MSDETVRDGVGGFTPGEFREVLRHRELAGSGDALSKRKAGPLNAQQE